MEHSFLIPLKIGNFDLSVSEPVIFMWGVCAVIFILLFLANQYKKVRAIEYVIYEFVGSAFGVEGKAKNPLWFTFLITLFLFIFFNNLCGLLPGGEHSHGAPTSNINVTAAMAIMVFILSQLAGLKAHGFHHFKNLVPSGVPKWMIPFLIPLEIISLLAKPFSLAIRLFANMFAGHKVLMIFVTLVILANIYIKLIPFVGVMILSLFEIFVAFIQAFIFTYLASSYINDAVGGAH